MRRIPAILCVAVLVLLTGCQARSSVDVDVNSDGSGSIDVKVALDKEAALAVPDLKEQLQTSDLVKAGWSVDGPSNTDGGGKTIDVHHGFASAEQANVLFRQLSGNGAPFVDFRLAQHHSLTKVETTFTGKLDLQQGVNSFGDLNLQQSVGSRLGFDPAEIEKALGVDWATTFPLDVSVHMPGNVKRTPTADDNTWHAQYASVVPLSASANGVNVRPLMYFGSSAAALIACALMLVFWKGGKYLPVHSDKTGGVRARDLLDE